MKVLFIPVYSNVEGLKKLYERINIPIDIVHIFSRENIDVPKNEYIKKMVFEKYDYRYKSLAQIWNHFIESYDLSNYVIMNDDILFENNFLKSFFEYIKENPNSLILTKDNEFTCFSISKFVIEKIGLFDENYEGAYYEDTDYTLRCEINNINIKKFDGDKFGYIHVKNSTMKTCDANHFNHIKNRLDLNGKYFQKKWGYTINEILDSDLKWQISYKNPFNLK